MLKKIIFLFVVIILPGQLSAQIIDSSKAQANTKDMVLEQKDGETVDVAVDNTVAKESAVDEALVDEEADNGIQVRVSPEEIIELETKSKKSIRRNLKNRDTTERENIIGIFTWQEKSVKIRELMREGKSYSEAKKIVEDTIKSPSINVKNDREMEKYMYKKGNFISNGK